MSVPARQGSNLRVRALSACVFVPAVLLLVEFSEWSLLLLILLVAGRGSWELFHMAHRAGRQPNRYLGTALALALCLHLYAVGTARLELAIVAVSLLSFVAALFGGTRAYTGRALMTLGGAIYLGLLGGVPLLIVRSASGEQRPEAVHLLVLVFLCIWLTDAAAYLCGRRWGRRKLIPAISPAKTVVGFCAGIVGGLAPVLLHDFLPSMTLPELLGLLLLASCGGQVGDLVESAIKRDMGVKDAPVFIPGHGGLLDRFDSYLVAFPLVYLYIRILEIF